MIDVDSSEFRLSDVIMNDLLSFSLPDFSRSTWVSPETQQRWHVKIAKAMQAWQAVELWSTREGMRPGCVTLVPPSKMATFLRENTSRQSVVLQLEKLARRTSFQTTSNEPAPGEEFDYRVAVVRRNLAQDFYAAWKGREDYYIGVLLGYPLCCSRFFAECWSRGIKDPVWEMSWNSVTSGVIPNECTVPSELNVFWRWTGIRAVPHLPCSFKCPRSLELARALLDFGSNFGLQPEMATIREVLSWPLNWSSLHGIAEINSPILRATMNSVATRTKRSVCILGSSCGHGVAVARTLRVFGKGA